MRHATLHAKFQAKLHAKFRYGKSGHRAAANRHRDFAAKP